MHFAICLSLMLAGLAVSDCGLSLLQASVSVLLEDQFSLGDIYVWRPVVQGQLWYKDRRQKDPVPSCSLVPVSWWLWTGPSWARNLSRNSGLTCAHRCVSTPGRPALSSGIWVWSAVAQDQLRAQPLLLRTVLKLHIISSFCLRLLHCFHTYLVF